METPDGYVALKGDASSRAYFRGNGHVLVHYPREMEDAFERYLFWHHQYGEMGLSVPGILHIDRKRLEMRIEDWGDVDGVEHFKSLPSGEARVSFVDDVWRQISGIQMLADHIPTFEPTRIDIATELTFFLEHAGSTIFSMRDTSWLSELCERVIQELTSEPWELAHRDYHFRNILVKRSLFCIIDFQDTQLAPVHYDTVSLLFDNYLDLGSLRQEICDGLDDLQLRWTALQRNLKALGTFCWFGFKANKPWFREAIPLAMSHVTDHLHVLRLEDEVLAWQELQKNAEKCLFGTS